MNIREQKVHAEDLTRNPLWGRIIEDLKAGCVDGWIASRNTNEAEEERFKMNAILDIEHKIRNILQTHLEEGE